MTHEEFNEEYERLAHAVQSAIAYEVGQENLDSFSLRRHLKHLWVGNNTVKADTGSLGRLLVKKGLITEDEYYEAVLEGMRGEVEFNRQVVIANRGLPPETRFS